MPVSPARAAAFDILLKVAQKDAYASELLHSERLRDLSAADRGLCTEIVMGVLRWRSALNEAIARHSSQKLPKLDAEVLTALRMAAYQIGFLERVPARAAVNESAELVKRARKRSAVPFVNAVLRRLATEGAIRPSGDGESAMDLARAYAHPLWLVERWVAQFGIARARAIAEYDQQPPVTAIRGSAEAFRDLQDEGVTLAAGALLATARRVVSGDVSRTRAFTEGRIHIQDEASQLVALLVGRGSHLLDCCAAPGGKTAMLAERNPEAHIVGAELHEHRADALRQRLQSTHVEVLTNDARSLPVGQDFDRVLVDVPCSGTGTLARNPEIKWKLRPEDIADLHERQVEILAAAMKHVAPGGRVVYSTCSLEREEDEAVVEKTLAGNVRFRIVNTEDELRQLREEGELSAHVASLTSGAYLRTIPGIHPCDGFFAAILERTTG